MKDRIHFLWKKWLAVTNAIGDVMSLVVMSAFYYTLFLVPSCYFSWFRDEVGRSFEEGSYLHEFPPEVQAMDKIEEM